ncbi:H-NS histone family protein [Variovorax sp. efr-133-TYG-130]|uniref:H-NS histone family protein n=1 Tax=Variovorax sp. efr-133-TYG-130 TaxID=3040327 RepID=UPI0025532656|nr:H-NS histone family protein [Variovorax sp. efr-133-TYG-130]
MLYASHPFSSQVQIMAKTFLQVQKQIEQLQKEAEHLRKKESDGVRSRIKEAISVYGFTAADLGFGKAPSRVAVTKEGIGKKSRKSTKTTNASAPKFKDEQGNVWSGRGPRPAWFKAALEAGKSADDLLAK